MAAKFEIFLSHNVCSAQALVSIPPVIKVITSVLNQPFARYRNLVQSVLFSTIRLTIVTYFERPASPITPNIADETMVRWTLLAFEMTELKAKQIVICDSHTRMDVVACFA